MDIAQVRNSELRMDHRLTKASVVSSPANNETSEDQIQGYWVEMAAINKACNDALFPSKAQTASFIQSGEYIQRLQQLQPIIKQWHDKISSSTGERLQS